LIEQECLIHPSNARGREDQCVEMNHLKQLLTDHLEKGLPQRYAWKQSMPNVSPTTSFLDLLGYKNYWDVFAAYKAWLEEVMSSNSVDDDRGSLITGELSSGSRQPHQIRHHKIISKQVSTLEGNSLDEKIGSGMKEDQAQLAEEEVEVVSTQNMANAVFKESLRLHDKVLQDEFVRL
jgi:hypothetical protein